MSDRRRLIGPTPPSGNTPPPHLHPAALRVRGRIAAAMLARHAISPEDAVAFTPDARDARDFAKLCAVGIVREAPGGRYWFDLIAYHLRDRTRSRATTIWGFGIALTIALVGSVSVSN